MTSTMFDWNEFRSAEETRIEKEIDCPCNVISNFADRSGLSCHVLGYMADESWEIWIPIDDNGNPLLLQNGRPVHLTSWPNNAARFHRVQMNRLA